MDPMATLFASGELRLFLRSLVENASKRLENTPEDEILARSEDDLTNELVQTASLAPLSIGPDPVDGNVTETTVEDRFGLPYGGGNLRALRVSATYEFDGDPRLLRYRPSTWLMTNVEADLGAGKIIVSAIHPGLNVAPEDAKSSLDSEIGKIRTNASQASEDAKRHNEALPGELGRLVHQRKDRIQKRRDLAGALGFPLERRKDAPRAVPLTRKPMGVARQRTAHRVPYKDEPTLTSAQYEDALAVVKATLRAMERTPSVASGLPEENLRDQILVQLNGTFEGGATGETFVQRGKTDILVVADDRHVFVGECKWWAGQKGCSEALDQLLSYLPWRDEKAALLLFIDRKDASAVIEKAEEAVRTHPAFKRVGASSGDPTSRRNFVLGSPEDGDREIQLAVLFAVLPKDARA